MLKTLSIILTGALCAGSASAEPVTVYGPTVPSARVSYADLDIGSMEGIKTLKTRVRSAASGLCPRG